MLIRIIPAHNESWIWFAFQTSKSMELWAYYLDSTVVLLIENNSSVAELDGLEASYGTN